MTPNRLRGDIKRSHGCERRQRRDSRTVTLGEIDRNHHAASDNTQNDEDIAAHLGEAQEDGCIEADAFHQLGLSRAQDGSHPGEEALAHWGRRMSAIRMFDFGRIHKGVTRTKEGEEEGEEDGDPGGGA